MPSQSHRGENTEVLEDIRFMSDQIIYDTLSEGKKNSTRVCNNRSGYLRSVILNNRITGFEMSSFRLQKTGWRFLVK